MASTASFDVSTGADLQEVDNAVNQAQKEIIQRYDFKGSKASIAFDRAKAILTLIADDLAVLRSPGHELLALQACHPRFFATHRYIAYARPVQVVPRHGTPYTISANGHVTAQAA